MSSSNSNNPLVVEFIGVTGVGKSTLLPAVAQFLAREGFCVREAEDAILARYGLHLRGRPNVRAVLVHLLALLPFCRWLFTANGWKLSRLALRSITRGMDSTWIGTSLLRNFLKRIGVHLLLQKMRAGRDCDIVLCDEGVVHAAHNLFVHAGSNPDREEIARFGRLVPKPDVLIWVTAPAAQSVNVILQRGHSRVAGTTAAAWAFVEHAHATFATLSSVEELRTKIFKIDNAAQAGLDEGAVRGRAAAIGEFLLEQIRTPQGAQVAPAALGGYSLSTVQTP